MRVTVNRSELSAAFAWAAGGLPKRPVLPVLLGMLLSVEGQVLTFGVFDYEQSRRGWLSGEHAEAGQILVDGSALKKVFDSLPKGTRARPAAVELSADAGTLTVSAGDVRRTLAALPAADYPDLPGLPPEAGVVDGAGFAGAVTRVAAAASRDDTLPMLTCVQFVAHPAALGLAATDRYRLAHDQLPWTPADPQAPAAEFLVPAEAAMAFAGKAGKSGKVTVHLSEYQSGYPLERVGFRDGTRELTIRPVSAQENGGYVRWNAMLRPKSPVNLTVDAKTLTEVLKRANRVTATGWREPARHGIVDLRYDDGTLTVHALGEDLLTTVATEPVPADADVRQFAVRFCAPYLWSVLEGIDGKAVIGLAGKDEEGRPSGDPVDLRERPRVATVNAAEADTFTAIVVPVQAAQGDAR